MWALSEDFVAILRYSTFTAALWFAGKLCKLLKLPSMLGEILAGVLLGPSVAQLVPLFWYGEFSVLQAMGQVGVGFLLFESGMEMDFSCLRQIGIRAALIAVTGMLLPIALTFLLVGVLFGHNLSPDSFAAGCALAPTSVGVAVALLSERDLIGSALGQTIVAAAALDDVLSLVLVLVLVNLHGGGNTVDLVLVLLGGLAFLFVGVGVFGGLLVPSFSSRVNGIQSLNDETILMIMFLALAGVSSLGGIIGSPIIGSFVAGTWFVSLQHFQASWSQVVKPFSRFLLPFFFGAVIAFSIPAKDLFEPHAIGRGLLVGLVSGVLGKLMVGFIATHLPWRERLTLGAAMVGRGELGFLIAEMSRKEGLISEELFVIVTWALILSIVISPLLFFISMDRCCHVWMNKEKSNPSQILGAKVEDPEWQCVLCIWVDLTNKSNLFDFCQLLSDCTCEFVFDSLETRADCSLYGRYYVRVAVLLSSEEQCICFEERVKQKSREVPWIAFIEFFSSISFLSNHHKALLASKEILKVDDHHGSLQSYQFIALVRENVHKNNSRWSISNISCALESHGDQMVIEGKLETVGEVTAVREELSQELGVDSFVMYLAATRLDPSMQLSVQ